MQTSNQDYNVSHKNTHMHAHTQSNCDNYDEYELILIFLPLLHSEMISKGNHYIIYHRSTNLLLHYLVKYDCSTVQQKRLKTYSTEHGMSGVQCQNYLLYYWLTQSCINSKVIPFKSVLNCLFTLNIYQRYSVPDYMSLCRLIYNITARVHNLSLIHI